MSLVGRYVLRESFASSLLVIAVLLLIFMSNQFAEILGDAAADELPRAAVSTIFALTFWRYLTFIAPIALLLGVLLALARLSRDSELAALAACGFGPGALLKPVGALGLAAAAGVGWLAFVTTPAANLTIEEIRFQAREQLDIDTVTAGSFTPAESGDGVLYVREVRGDVLYGVFMQAETDRGNVIVVAERGERVQNRETGQITLRLINGRRYEGTPGRADYFVAEFAEHGLPVRTGERSFDPEIDAAGTFDLLARGDAESRAELEWRVAAPLSTFLLVLLAVPLSRSSPREGRFGRVLIGALLCIIYLNTLSMARVWVERELVPPWLGMWWTHALLAGFVCILLLRESGVLIRPRLVQSVEKRHEPVA